MEDHQFSPISLCCFYQEEEIGELRQALMYTTVEQETTIISAKEEIARKELELIQLKDALAKTVKERDEAQTKCQRLILDKLMLEQELHQKQQESISHSAGTCTTEDSELKAGDSSAIPSVEQILPSSSVEEEELKLEVKKPLPEKGKLLKAVMEAGPLLQILLLAGQLPQWQHPPPQLHSVEIPPVAISSPRTPVTRQNSSDSLTNGNSLSKKRAFELSETLSFKHQRIADVLH